MEDNRDMYYGNYGYAGAFPNPMMMPQMMPQMIPQTQNTFPTQATNPYPYQNYNTNDYDYEIRLNRLERQIKNLNQRVTRLENPYNNTNNTTNIYNEPDSNMYMM